MDLESAREWSKGKFITDKFRLKNIFKGGGDQRQWFEMLRKALSKKQKARD